MIDFRPMKRSAPLFFCLLWVCASVAPIASAQDAAQGPAVTPAQASAQAPAAPIPQQPALTRPDPKRAQKAAERGDKAQAEGRIEDALAAYDEAARYAPENVQIVSRGAALRGKLTRQHEDNAESLALQGKISQAVDELRTAMRLDPNNSIMAERLSQIAAMEGDGARPRANSQMTGIPQIKPQAGKRNFNLRGDAKTVYEEAAAAFGIKVSFDPELTSRNVRLNVDDVDFNTLMSVLGAETATFWTPINATQIFVAPDTIEKRKQYALQATQTFVLSESVEPSEMTEVLRVLREITNASRIELDTNSRTITMRDTPERLSLAQQVIRQIERARGEMMLEVELLEVDRTAATQLGLTPPSTIQAFSLNSNDINALRQSADISNALTILGQIFNSQGLSSIPPFTAVGGGYTTFLLTLPAEAANFSDALTLVRSGQQVLLRAQDGKPATFFVGDRYPVTLSLLSGSLSSGTGLTNPASLGFTGIPTATTFPETVYSVGHNPEALAAADFNGDSLVDLAVANENDNSVSVLRNQDNGNFIAEIRSPFLLPTTADGPVAVAAGNLQTASSTQTLPLPALVIANAVSNNVTVLLDSLDASGNVVFTEAPGSPYAVGNSPSSIVLADFNGDGNLDFAVTNKADNTVSVFRGNGQGGFTEFPGSPFGLGGAFAINTTSLPSAVLNQPYTMTLQASSITGPVTWSIIAGTLPSGLALNPSTGAISGTPTATGTSSLTLRAAESGSAPQVATTTLLLPVEPSPPALRIANSLGNGSVGAAYSQTLVASGGKAPYNWSIVSGALPPGLSLAATTGAVTGTPATAGASTFTVQVADSSAPALIAQQQFTLLPSNGSERSPVALVAVNLRQRTIANGNNFPEMDLAVANQASNSVGILLGGVDANGNAIFTEAPSSPLAVGQSPVGIATGDLNSDGVPDLAVLNQGDNTISILLGSTNLDGTFLVGAGSPLSTGATPAGIVIANFTGALTPDIAVTNQGVSTLGVYIGLGGGQFSSRIEVQAPTTPGAIVSSVLTSSGLPDVALTAQGAASQAGVVAVFQDPSTLAGAAGNTGAGQIPYPGSEFIDLGVKVKATPRLHPDHEVTLQLEFEIRALAGTSINGIPVISNRTLTQTIRVKEDETTMIGGLLDKEETLAISGLPGMATVPAAGYAFGNNNNTRQDNEFLILVTPRRLRSRPTTTSPAFAGSGEGEGNSPGERTPPVPSPPRNPRPQP